jgi:hypothetical protein
LRYNTSGPGFTDPSSWEAFDPGYNEGYSGGTFDGRYVYFSPQSRIENPNREVLRYDTSGGFTTSGSWVSSYPGFGQGFDGAVYDGARFIYFAGFVDGPGGLYGEQARCDTWGSFTDSASWVAFDPGEHGVGTDPDGYRGAIFDGRHVYFVPFDNGTERHGEVLRYDISDADRDGVSDDVDNCPNTPNSDQANSDPDPLGDACDPCIDPNSSGVCIPTLSEWGMVAMAALMLAAGAAVVSRRPAVG